MNKRLVGYIILVNIVFSILVPTSLSESDEASWWDDNWSFRDEIVIPIDTSSEHAKYQPVDILINFNDSCWAKNEDEHSVRVIVQADGRFVELESQIYDLNFSDETHISSCGLVFLHFLHQRHKIDIVFLSRSIPTKVYSYHHVNLYSVTSCVLSSSGSYGPNPVIGVVI